MPGCVGSLVDMARSSAPMPLASSPRVSAENVETIVPGMLRSGEGRGVTTYAPAVADPLVLVDDPRPAVRRLTLNRPQKRNALSTRIARGALHRVARGGRDASVHAVVIRGAGPCFSAGYDLAQDPSEQLPWAISRADGAWARHVVQGWFEMWDMATPLIAQVHGFCLAGGTELAAAV